VLAVLVALGLASLTGAAAVGGPAGRSVEEVRLSPARPPWPRCAPALAPSDVAPPEGFAPLTGSVAGVRVLLADVRPDGVLDAWAPVRPGQAHWLPLARPIVLTLATEDGLEPRELTWRPAADGRSLQSTVLPAPDVAWSWPAEWGPLDPPEDGRLRALSALSRTAALRALARLNDLRMRNGLPPGRLDPARSADAFLHALYISRTGDFGHAQRAGRWASAAGAASGQRSGITRDADPVASHYLTILHRLLLFRRETPAFGVGAVGDVTVLDGSAWDADVPWSEAGECIPGPFAEEIPLVARDEMPRPHADQVVPARGGVIGGFPVTVRLGRRGDGSVRDVEGGLVQLPKASPATLAEAHAALSGLADAWRAARRKAGSPSATREDAAAADVARRAFLDGVRARKGKEVPVLLSWPGNPCAVIGGDRSNGGAIALLPRSPLLGGTSYLWWLAWTDLWDRGGEPGGVPHGMVEVFTTQ
jgi:hypothetical protein